MRMIPSLDVIRHVLPNMTDNSGVVDVYEFVLTSKFSGPDSLGRSQKSQVVIQKSSNMKEFLEYAKGKDIQRQNISLMVS